MVLTFRNVHNWMSLDFAPQAFAAMFRALKPGGILGVVEHRGDPARPQDPHAASGYVNEDYAIELIEAAGFELVARSGDQRQPEGYEGLRARRLDAATELPPREPGAREVPGHRRERPVYLEVQQAGGELRISWRTGDCPPTTSV